MLWSEQKRGRFDLRAGSAEVARGWEAGIKLAMAALQEEHRRRVQALKTHEITIADVRTMEQGTDKEHTAYIVSVKALKSDGQTHTLPKRYSQFEALKKDLKSFGELDDAQMARAPFPKKELLGGGTDAAVVQERHKQLAVSLPCTLNQP